MTIETNPKWINLIYPKNKMNEQMGNWLNSYGVFCTAMCLPNRNERELDILWETACAVYQDFLESEYNDPNESELDCIQNFVTQSRR